MRLFKQISLLLISPALVIGCIKSQSPIELPSIATEKHIDIPLYKLSIIPPDASFKVSNFSTQIYSENYSCYFNFSIYNKSIGEILTQLNESGNIESVIETKQELLISNNVMHGKIIEWTFENYIGWDSTHTWFFLLGDSSNTYSVDIKYPEKNHAFLGGKILQSLSSIVYNYKSKKDPFAISSFSFDLTSTPLQFAGVSYGMLMFSLNGEIPTSSSETFLTIISFPGFIEENERERYAKDRIKESYTELIELNPVIKGSLNGFEVNGKNREDYSLLYNMILFDSDRFIAISGVAENYTDEFIELFRSLNNTFKLK